MTSELMVRDVWSNLDKKIKYKMPISTTAGPTLPSLIKCTHGALRTGHNVQLRQLKARAQPPSLIPHMGFGWSVEERDPWIVPTFFFGGAAFARAEDAAKHSASNGGSLLALIEGLAGADLDNEPPGDQVKVDLC
ncbi:hypothetical protein AYO21_09255 [Fonsecaea monophora]|uniref:Uncharacterized protein n=1 Tax=Fonsecaea monophora TaxID=254056 RepID=A0A177EWT9_9EURO|nr:hypothetical protein AYO21_09255 [Fonsecaea monophora]OAG36524.1 hypothetical protein AYO21_09255 [Fonsecaea monophora]